jgi:hypothetical protein
VCEKNAESVVATQQVQGELTLEGVAINSPKVKHEFETTIISEAGADSGAFRYDKYSLNIQCSEMFTLRYEKLRTET